MHVAARLLLPALLLASWPAGPARARVYMSQQQALAAAFPAPAIVERRTLFLSEQQLRQAATVAGTPVDSRVVIYYAGVIDGKVTGYAYFDAHVVRTLPETIMMLVGPDDRVVRIDILSFDEPEDYFPKDRWREQFHGRVLEDDLALDRGIRTLTGATLSARAVTAAARRILAIHRLFIAPRSPAGPVEEPAVGPAAPSPSPGRTPGVP